MTPRAPFDPELRAPKLAPWGAVLALAGGAVGGWVGVPLALLGVSLLLLACVSRRDGFLLVGPVAGAELARAARLGRPQLWRSVYALTAGLIVFLNLFPWLAVDRPFDPPSLRRDRLAQLNESLAASFAVVLFVYVALLTVQVMAGAITEEREKKRWDALLTTDLRGREILLGKLFGRLPVVLDPILAALPVLAILPLFGGVPPWLAGCAVLCCVAVMFGLGGVTLFFSLFSKARGSAAGATFFLTFLYLVVSSAAVLLYDYPAVVDFPRNVWPGCGVTLGDVVHPFVAGNPLAAGLLLSRGGVDLETAAPVAAWHFALFQFGVFFLFGLTAIRRLPVSAVWGGPSDRSSDTLSGTQRVKVAAKQAGWADRKPTDPPPELKPEKEPVDRPPVPDWPIVWWERFGWLNKGQAAFVTKMFTWRLWAVAGVAFAFYFGLRVFEWVWPSDPRLVREVANIALMPVLIFGIAFLFPPAFRAARCVAKEREADTLDGLLLLPLSRREILFQKWLGVALCDWPGFAPILAVLAMGVLTGFLPVSAALVYALTVPVLVGVLAAWGLYFSVTSKTARAAIARLVMFLIAMTFVLNVAATALSGPFGRPPTYRSEILGVSAVFPPAAFPILMAELERSGPPKSREFNPGGVLAAWLGGLTAYAATGGLAFWLAARRFESEKGA